MRVTHAGNPYEWRPFKGYGAGNISDLPLDSALGGFGDGINDGYLVRGESSFSNMNVLVPINLYTVHAIASDFGFTPIGTPPGIRMVHMRNIDPKATFSVGDITYRVFPAISKQSGTTMPAGLGNWRTYESSYYVGYAYPEM